MNLLVCLLLVAASPVDQAVDDAAALFPADAPYIRYLYLDNIEDEKEREHHLAVISFTLNSVSAKKKIVLPTFANKEKTLIKFDIRDYGFDEKAYRSLGVDPYTKKTDKLKLLTKSENPIMRSDWFIIKAMTAPTYYKLLGVSNLKDFNKRHGHDPDTAKKLKIDQAAVVILSSVVRSTRYLKRTPTPTGAIWESRDRVKDDNHNFLGDLLSEKYDSVQLFATNANGLLSYFAADGKGQALDFLDADISVDRTKSFSPDLVVRVGRNCVACHVTGVLPFQDTVREMIKKDIKLLAPDKDASNRLADLFGAELPIQKDQDDYEVALKKTTGMDPKTFTHKFVSVWTIYYTDVTLEQAAKEMGMKADELKKYCLDSGQAALVHLAVFGKLPRVHFEEAIKR